jgi:hypothetical protein
MEGLESSLVFREEPFSRTPSGKIWKKWSTFGAAREFHDSDFATAYNDISGPQ